MLTPVKKIGSRLRIVKWGTLYGFIGYIYQMCATRTLLSFQLLTAASVLLNGQGYGPEPSVPDSSYLFFGIVCDEVFRPVTATHVINLNNNAGDVTDSLGIFSLPVRKGDTLFVRNIVYRDTLIPVDRIGPDRHIRIRSAVYRLQEARVFEWGSGYNDFRKAIISRPEPETLAGQLGLPRQDPDYVPFEMNEARIKSVGFLIHSPVSYFYENFSKSARSKRKVYWLNRNRDKLETFEALISPDNIAGITGLDGNDLQEFLLYLYQHLECDHRCDEIRVYTEIHTLWKVYKETGGSEN